jgi:hypothetical protein
VERWSTGGKPREQTPFDPNPDPEPDPDIERRVSITRRILQMVPFLVGTLRVGHGRPTGRTPGVLSDDLGGWRRAIVGMEIGTGIGIDMWL